ncbi:MAG: metalloregulator ArsR/SmtB family transcription factor [candidate division NC10 bacterium]
MASTDDQIYELHASVCQILANPTRLKVLNALREQEIAVADLARRVGTSMPNLSQHLAILRQRGVVLTRREGATIYYRIANPKILRAFDIMREVLFEQIAGGRRLVRAAGAGARRSRTAR